MLPGVDNPTAGGGGGACHVVAMAYPGRGHINPMINICRSLRSKHPNIRITFVVTEEWLGLIGPEDKAAVISDKFQFATVPNVIPSEHGRAKDFQGFVKAVCTKLQAPFEKVLDELVELPVTTIIADTYLPWMSEVGNRRGIPVASLWTMSASVFSVFLHFDLLRQQRHYPVGDFSGIGEETVVDYIPGLPPTRIVDLQPFICEASRQVLPVALEAASLVSKLQYLLFTSPYEIEPQTFDALKRHFSVPVYPIGPSIPYLKLQATTAIKAPYLEWLDAQPKASVLYVSMGSFLSASKQQMDEIVAGVENSGVRFLLISRDGIIEAGGGGAGMVVPWCDQLRVLCHDSVGGFWTHCGLNSTLESLFAGVPMLCWPLHWDQIPNCKSIVDDWRVGWRARKRLVGGEELVVTRDEVAEMVRRFMDSENGEVKEMRERAAELRRACRAAVADGGSSDLGLDCFVKDISNQVQAK